MIVVPYPALESEYFKLYKEHLLVMGVRPLLPTWDRVRLASLLTTSRALQTEDVSSTLFQRSVTFLLAGGWMHKELREVGLAVLSASAARMVNGADVLRTIEADMLLLAVESDETDYGDFAKTERRHALHAFVDSPSDLTFMAYHFPQSMTEELVTNMNLPQKSH